MNGARVAVSSRDVAANEAAVVKLNAIGKGIGTISPGEHQMHLPSKSFSSLLFLGLFVLYLFPE